MLRELGLSRPLPRYPFWPRPNPLSALSSRWRHRVFVSFIASPKNTPALLANESWKCAACIAACIMLRFVRYLVGRVFCNTCVKTVSTVLTQVFLKFASYTIDVTVLLNLMFGLRDVPQDKQDSYFNISVNIFLLHFYPPNQENLELKAQKVGLTYRPEKTVPFTGACICPVNTFYLALTR